MEVWHSCSETNVLAIIECVGGQNLMRDYLMIHQRLDCTQWHSGTLTRVSSSLVFELKDVTFAGAGDDEPEWYKRWWPDEMNDVCVYWRAVYRFRGAYIRQRSGILSLTQYLIYILFSFIGGCYQNFSQSSSPHWGGFDLMLCSPLLFNPTTCGALSTSL